MASAEEKGGRLVKLSGAVTKTIAFQTAWGGVGKTSQNGVSGLSKGKGCVSCIYPQRELCFQH